VCYQRARGYCGERTGWIQHLLANDLYVLACQQNAVNVKNEYMTKALKYVDGALTAYPDGFADPTQFKSTNELKILLIAKRCPTPPPAGLGIR
jgi:hypothetical protein